LIRCAFSLSEEEEKRSYGCTWEQNRSSLQFPVLGAQKVSGEWVLVWMGISLVPQSHLILKANQLDHYKLASHGQADSGCTDASTRRRWRRNKSSTHSTIGINYSQASSVNFPKPKRPCVNRVFLVLQIHLIHSAADHGCCQVDGISISEHAKRDLLPSGVLL